MEYSLYYLNKQANLNNLKIKELIDNLNLIGFEVDDVFEEQLPTNPLINDIRLLIEIPSNRQDLLNEKLFLKEISTIFLLQTYNLWKKVKINYDFLLDTHLLKYKEQPIKYINSDLNDILIYKFNLENCFLKTSPHQIQQKLKNRGVSINNNINDYLNLIILEYGATITNQITDNNGDQLFIERLNTTANFKGITLSPGTIVITDQNKKLISVLGCININNDNNFTNGNVGLEAIFYDIYLNSLDLKTINTKLSFKYLRSLFIENFKVSLKRLFTLLELYNVDLKIVNVHTNEKVKKQIKKHKIITLSKNLTKLILNTEFFDFSIFKKAGLRIIGETKNNFYIQISNFRKDLTREIDLIEEYSRFIGYKNFPEILPKKAITYNPRKLKNYKKIREFFINYGFNEIFTNSLVPLNAKTKSFSIDLKNPLNTEINTLRTSMFPRLFNILELNLKSGFKNCNFFEIGRVFKVSENKIIEQDKISGIFQSQFISENNKLNLNWFKAKGFFEIFLQLFGHTNLEISTIQGKTNYFHPTRSIQFTIDKKILGTFGEINPLIEEFHGISEPIYLFEFNLGYFKNWKIKSTVTNYNQYSKYPSVTRDISLILDKKTSFSELKDKIQKRIKHLKSIKFFDVQFDSKQSDKVNLGIRLEFQVSDRTLTAIEIEQEIKNIENLLKEKYNVNIRD